MTDRKLLQEYDQKTEEEIWTGQFVEAKHFTTLSKTGLYSPVLLNPLPYRVSQEGDCPLLGVSVRETETSQFNSEDQRIKLFGYEGLIGKYLFG